MSLWLIGVACAKEMGTVDHFLHCGCSWSAFIWKMVPSCLLWCLWRVREINYRNFKDRERRLEELKSFYSLFTWTSVFLALLVISFNKFLLLFSTLSFSCILLYTWVAHCAFNDILIIYIYIYKI